MIIAIDGQAGSGKGTLAKGLANYFKLAYLETGLIYRALGYKAAQQKVAFDDVDQLSTLAQTIDETEFDNEALRSEEVASYASKVSQHAKVRSALLDYQRKFANKPPKKFQGTVLDGRDIGTVVCPDAHVKIFVIASIEERARRRIKDLQIRGVVHDAEQILKDIEIRDKRDSERSEAPMKPAADAWVLDTSDMGINEVLAAGMDYVRSKVQK